LPLNGALCANEVDLKILIALFILLTLCSCAVIKEDFYYPRADGGSVEKESCRGQVGADNTMILNFKGVVSKFSIRIFGDKRFFSITLTIPDGAEVIWPKQTITGVAEDTNVDLTISSFARVVSRGDNYQTAEYLAGSIMKNNSDSSEDEYFESILLPNKSFEVLTIENLNIIINGETLSIPSIRFEKSSGYFLHPLNC
jgi:DUF4097 and DUF4098 domain-containing protein YvlB